LPEGLSTNAEFIADMKLLKNSWFYAGGRRLLLVMKPKDKADAKLEDIIEEYRGLGESACAALQAKKLDDVLVLFTATVAEAYVNQGMGNFANAAILANYEYRFEKAKAPAKEGEDPRAQKTMS